jgi:hypothetical protein
MKKFLRVALATLLLPLCALAQVKHTIPTTDSNNTWNGLNTYVQSPQVPTPVLPADAVPKSYVDANNCNGSCVLYNPSGSQTITQPNNTNFIINLPNDGFGTAAGNFIVNGGVQDNIQLGTPNALDLLNFYGGNILLQADNLGGATIELNVPRFDGTMELLAGSTITLGATGGLLPGIVNLSAGDQSLGGTPGAINETAHNINLNGLATISTLTPGTAPICPNGTGGALTQVGCAGGGGSGGITQLIGDVAAGPGSGSVATTLATVNSSPGACGDATHVCQITTNAKGLTTAQTPVAISGSGSGVSSLNSLTGALNITAGAGVTVTPSGSNIQIATTGSGASLTPATVLITVAASNSINKTAAQYIATGTNDQTTINTAIAACPSTVPGSVGPAQCTVVLQPGVYKLSATVDIDTDDVTLTGEGQCHFGSVLNFPWDPSTKLEASISTGCSQLLATATGFPIISIEHNNAAGASGSADNYRHRGIAIRYLYLVGDNYGNSGIATVGNGGSCSTSPTYNSVTTTGCLDDNVLIENNVIQRTNLGINVLLDSPIIRGNSIQDNNGDAEHICGVFARVSNELLFDNQGILMAACSVGGIYADNVLGDTQSDAIHFYQSHATASNNSFSGIMGSAYYVDNITGISITGGSVDYSSDLLGYNTRGQLPTAADAVHISGGANDISVTGMTFDSGLLHPTGYAINDLGSGDSVSGNTVSGTWRFGNTGPVINGTTQSGGINISSAASTPAVITSSHGCCTQFQLANSTSSTSMNFFVNGSSAASPSWGGVFDNVGGRTPVAWTGGSALYLNVPAAGVIGFTSSAGRADQVPDTGISRGTAGVFDFGTGAQGSTAGKINAALVTAPVAGAEVVTFSATPTFSTSVSTSRIVLTASITSFTLGAGADGQQKTLCFKQGAGPFTVTAPANVHGFFTVGTTSVDWNCQSYVYDTTDSIWLATSLGATNM